MFKQALVNIDNQLNNFISWIHAERKEGLSNAILQARNAFLGNLDIQTDPDLVNYYEDVTDRFKLGRFAFQTFGCPFRTANLLKADSIRPWKKAQTQIPTQEFLASLDDLQAQLNGTEFWADPPDIQMMNALNIMTKFGPVMAHAEPDEAPVIQAKLSEVYGNFIKRTAERMESTPA